MKKILILTGLFFFIYGFVFGQNEKKESKTIQKTEKSTSEQTKYIDKNGDGINDLIQANQGRHRYGKEGEIKSKKDLFIDQDGDGICDNRAKGLGLRMKNRIGQQGKWQRGNNK